MFEDEVDARDIVATEIGAKHDAVRRVPTKGFGVDLARQQLDITTSTKGVVLLLVFYGELDDEGAVRRRSFFV